MHIKDVADVSSTVQTWYSKGRDAARQNNYSYAVEMLRMSLKSEPGLFEARELLRSTAISHVGNLSGFKKNMVNIKNALTLNVKIPGAMKKGDYAVAMDLAEAVLSQDPYNVQASKLLAEAAEAVELYPVAVFALEVIYKSGQKDEGLITWLSELYVLNDQSDKAVNLCQLLVRLFPESKDAQYKLKNIIAKSAMDSGGLSGVRVETDEEKAAKIASEEAALEENSDGPKRVKRNESLAASEYLEQIESGDDNVSVRKKLAKVYLKEEKFDEAIECLEKAKGMGGQNDPSLDRDYQRAVIARFDFALQSWTEHGNQGETESAEAAIELEKLNQQKNDFLLEVTREKASKYKNDANVSMELANLLWEKGDYEEATKCYQKAERSNRHRFLASLRKGQCLMKQGLAAEAVEAFQSAVSDSRADDKKVEALAELLGAQRASGDASADSTLAQIKEINADYTEAAPVS